VRRLCSRRSASIRRGGSGGDHRRGGEARRGADDGDSWPRAGGILTSGDAAQDRAEQAEFARLARTKHRLEISSLNPSRAILAIGDEDWPFPVPIVRAGGKWSFDVSETPAEMHARRIGANELDAIEICHDT